MPQDPVTASKSPRHERSDAAPVVTQDQNYYTSIPILGTTPDAKTRRMWCTEPASHGHSIHIMPHYVDEVQGVAKSFHVRPSARLRDEAAGRTLRWLKPPAGLAGRCCRLAGRCCRRRERDLAVRLVTAIRAERHPSNRGERPERSAEGTAQGEHAHQCALRTWSSAHQLKGETHPKTLSVTRGRPAPVNARHDPINSLAIH
eukprot:scaffold25143_cov28-Tisochrysis_lutea.AAC.2